MDRFKPVLAQDLTFALKTIVKTIVKTIETAPLPAIQAAIQAGDLEFPHDPKMGDFAYPCFRLAKTLKKNPVELAKSILAALPLATLTQPQTPPQTQETNAYTAEVAGPYVNFTLKPAALFQTVLHDILQSSVGAPYGTKEVIPGTPKQKWVFEFSSPNVAKPFQIYHLRTTIVGSALSKIATLRGFDVTRINHLGDWGTQYGKIAVALKRYEKEIPSELTLKILVDIYVKIHKEIETDPVAGAVIEQEAQIAFQKLENGDPELRAIWKRCLDVSLKEFYKVYERFGVEFDHYWGESHYETFLKPLLKDLRARGILITDQGAGIVPVTNRAGAEIPPCMLEKSDGASIYATRDLAAALYRKENLNFDRMSYVVGKEQMLHFEQLFGVLRKMNLDWEKNLEHIATGLYRFKDAKMSTRKGNFVTLDEVLGMCEAKALELMQSRESRESSESAREIHASFTKEEITQVSKEVALGAIVFADLSTDPARDLEFDIDRVISFEGETGPYLQYARTRAQSILRKASQAGLPTLNLTDRIVCATTQLHLPQEIMLLKTLGRFPSILDRTLDQRKPSVLAGFLVDVVQIFSAFYRECKVMNPDQIDLTIARLTLVEATFKTLDQGLKLLGIPRPDKM